MKKTTIVLFLIFLSLAVAACTTDPRDQADADNSRILAYQQAADQEAARLQRQVKFEEMLKAFQAEFPTVIFGLQLITLALAVSLSVSLVGTGSGIGWAGFHLGQVAVHAAQVKADLIHMDAKTRTFPLILQYICTGIYTCTNSNTGSVMELNTRRPEHADLVRAISALNHDGMIAFEAGHAHNEQPVHNIRNLIEQFEEMVNHANN
jgi:hypothetical protein